MKSKVQIRNHPLHPMLILLPAGAFILALILDVVYMFTGNVDWWAATYPVLLVGVIGALVAAVPGLIDLVAVVPKKHATRVGVAHMVTNLVLVGVQILNVSIRMGAEPPPASSAYGGFWVSLVGVGLLLIGGWLGGAMVYEYRVAVVEGPEAKDVRREATIVETERVDRRPPRGAAEAGTPA